MIAPPERSAAHDGALRAALPGIAEHGWTAQALRAALPALGLDPAEAEWLFPGGAADMIEAFADLADREMALAMAGADTAEMGLTKRVRLAIALRLAFLRPHRQAVRRAALHLAADPLRAARIGARTADAIWHAAGDSSADLSWYTKRAILIAIHSSTLLAWLRDDGEDDAATLAFLDRRLALVGRIGRLRGRLSRVSLPRPGAPPTHKDPIMALTIYGVPKSRAIRTLWMAHELAAPYALVEVAPGPEGSRLPENVARNPNGTVPFIEDDGLVLFESFAINLHLAKSRGGPLAPANAAEDSLMTMWAVWCAATLEPPAATAMYHTAFYPPEKREKAKAEAAIAELAGPVAVLEQSLAKGGGYLVGGRFTVADLNAISVAFYLRFVPQVLAGFPGVRAWYEAGMARPANRAAFALRGD